MDGMAGTFAGGAAGSVLPVDWPGWCALCSPGSVCATAIPISAALSSAAKRPVFPRLRCTLLESSDERQHCGGRRALLSVVEQAVEVAERHPRHVNGLGTLPQVAFEGCEPGHRIGRRAAVL